MTKRREVDKLETSEHGREVKRMRAYSTDEPDASALEDDTNKRRTRSDLSVKEWRLQHQITVSDESVPEPFREFSQTPFGNVIQQALTRAGFAKPTAIQAQAWSIGIAGKDMISIAKTGSGKTCAFLLPVFHKLHQDPTRKAVPRLLVLAPTRELSVQILEEAIKFGRGIRSVCCYGGSPKSAQIAALHRGVDCIIATPGRLNDLIEMRRADLSTIEYLVLDEADRMLDMGFEPQIRSIVEQIPTNRQTMLFSATWPREIQRLARDFLRPDSIQINVGEVNALVANKDIEQNIVMCSEDGKFDKLKEILDRMVEEYKEQNSKHAARPVNNAKEHGKTIVFVAKKVRCHDLANELWDSGYAVDSLHGDRQQWERTRVMEAFKASKLRLLIATDVAARGLDVKDVSCVINFDMPSQIEDYVHRIGRTGRAGEKGKAYSFFSPKDKKVAAGLAQVLQKAEQKVPDELAAMVRPRGFGGGFRRGGSGGGRGYMGSGRGYMGNGRSGGFGGGSGGFRGGANRFRR